jgi:hypothetical protein
MFYVVFLDPPDDAYVATEEEAMQLIRSRVPDAVFTPWRGSLMRAYQDEPARNFAESQIGSGQARCAAFVIRLSESGAAQ